MKSYRKDDNNGKFNHIIQSDLDHFISTLSRNAYALIDCFQMRNDEPNKMIVAVLYNKILNDFDSVKFLLERGMIDQAYALLRIMLEKRFILKAIVIDRRRTEDFHKEILYLKIL